MNDKNSENFSHKLTKDKMRKVAAFEMYYEEHIKLAAEEFIKKIEREMKNWNNNLAINFGLNKALQIFKEQFPMSISESEKRE